METILGSDGKTLYRVGAYQDTEYFLSHQGTHLYSRPVGAAYAPRFYVTNAYWTWNPTWGMPMALQTVAQMCYKAINLEARRLG